MDLNNAGVDQGITERRKWRALHAVEDEHYEILEVVEQSNATFVYLVGGHSATFRDADSAIAAADTTFARLFPSHSCGVVCRRWVLWSGGSR